jgi:hypothetical protein
MLLGLIVSLIIFYGADFILGGLSPSFFFPSSSTSKNGLSTRRLSPTLT